MGRTLRCLRTIRFLRFMQMKRISGLWRDHASSETAAIGVEIFSRIGWLILMNHIIACIWYGLALESHNGLDWVHQNGINDRSLAYRYTSSLHWALTQLQGSVEIYPCNAKERAFTIATIL